MHGYVLYDKVIALHMLGANTIAKGGLGGRLDCRYVKLISI